MALSPAPEGTFCLAALPDTQAYAWHAPHIFHAETDWIVAHREEQRIVFVSHVGDLVHDFEDLSQWAVAVRAMSRLDGQVPYGLCLGNNDMAEAGGDASNFAAMFPPRHFTTQPWYGGHFRENTSNYQLVKAEGLQLLMLHLECNAPDDVLAWAEGVLAAHPDRLAVVTTHAFLGPIDKPRQKQGYFNDPKGVMAWSRCHGERGNSPAAMWEKCLRRHAGIRLILCGDQSRSQAMHVTLTGQQGNIVHACLSDYRDGYLRLYRFVPRQGRIEVFTYSAISHQLCPGTEIVPDPSAHQFTLPFEPLSRE